MRWLRGNGVRFRPLTQWQFSGPRRPGQVRGRFGGRDRRRRRGLSDALFKAAEQRGVTIAYGTRAVSLIESEQRRRRRARASRHARASISPPRRWCSPAGGFEANTEWRTRYLGPGWELAKVRGSRFNTGDGLRMALEHRRHAVRQLVRLPLGELGSRRARRQRAGARRSVQARRLPLRHHGQCPRRALRRRRRRYPRAHLRQDGARDPGAAGPGAWQIFDRKAAHLLHDEYRAARATGCRADTLAELARRASTASTAMLCSPPSSTSIARCNAMSRSIRAGRTAAAPWASRCRSRTGRPPSTSRRSRPIR